MPTSRDLPRSTRRTFRQTSCKMLKAFVCESTLKRTGKVRVSSHDKPWLYSHLLTAACRLQNAIFRKIYFAIPVHCLGELCCYFSIYFVYISILKCLWLLFLYLEFSHYIGEEGVNPFSKSGWGPEENIINAIELQDDILKVSENKFSLATCRLYLHPWSDLRAKG